MVASSRSPYKAAPFFPSRPRVAEWVEAGVLPLDRLFNRIYGSRYNPLLQSGTLAIFFLGLLVVTGLYLLIFYKIGTPYESVAALEAQWWGGRWIRGVHSYAGDAMLIAVGFHALRMVAKGRTWGPRALAWITGVLAVGVMAASAWTGLVLVWDIQGQLVAVEGAKLLDVLPIFSEPIQRNFTDPAGVARGFFFLNLILHMVIPFLLVVTLVFHTQRVARPVLLPPRPVAVWAAAALLGLTFAWPLDMLPAADPFRVLGRVPVDWFYGLWLLVSRNAPPVVTLVTMAGVGLVLVSVPYWWRPAGRAAAAPSYIDPQLCTGCTQCYQDCPYEAISMVPPPPNRHDVESVGRINPALCVSCGICAGSCAPALVGPPGRNGRELLTAAKGFVGQPDFLPGAVVVMACAQGLGPWVERGAPEGFHPYPVHCSGAMHTSVVEYLLRRGAAGVYLLSCPGRDCIYREGPKWAHERLYNDREAELQPRVDKRRVRLGLFGRDERREALADMMAFRAAMAALDLPPPEGSEIQVGAECEVVEEKEVAHG